MVEFLLEILTKREDVRCFTSLTIELDSLTNAADEGISSISKENIVNWLGKHDFSCDQVFLVVGSI